MLFVAVVGYGTWSGVRTYRWAGTVDRARAVSDTPRDGDPVHIAGTIVGPAAGHTLESKFARRPCVAHAYEVIKERSATPGEDVRRSPRVRFRRGTGSETIPFVVAANGQSIHVNGTDATVEWRSIDYDSISPGDIVRSRDGLGAVLALLRRMNWRRDRRRIYREARLEAGDSVHVVGAMGPGTAETDASVSAGTDVPLTVSTDEPAALAQQFRRRARKRLFLTAIAVAVAVFVGLTWAGIV